MSKEEVQNLSNEDLLSEWVVIKAAFSSPLPQHLSNHQSLILFANFVNVSDEITKRGLDKQKVN